VGTAMPLAAHGEVLALLDARGNFNGDRDLFLDPAGAPTILARRLDARPLAAAVGAGGDVDHLAEERILDAAHLPLTRTCRAGLLARSARAVAGLALAVTLELDFLGDARGNLGQ